MKTQSFLLSVVMLLVCFWSGPLTAQDATAQAQTASMIGTITDTNNDTVPGATVVIENGGSRQSIVTNQSGFFEVHGLLPGAACHVHVTAEGFAPWDSPEIVLAANEYKILTGAKLRLQQTTTTVDVRYSAEEVAIEQVKAEETQRVLGIIPNFYVVYDAASAEPMTTKLKFHMALRVARDPITLAGVAFISGIEQAADTPNYQQGARGYGQRVGANAADGFSNIMIGGAILPSLLHQDPRYFYQGPSYSKKSRTMRAMMHPFVCKSDAGTWQVNYSSMGGDLASSALSNLYYPHSNRGVGLVFSNFAVDTAERVVSAIVQEFVLPKFTSHSKPK